MSDEELLTAATCIHLGCDRAGQLTKESSCPACGFATRPRPRPSDAQTSQYAGLAASRGALGEPGGADERVDVVFLLPPRRGLSMFIKLAVGNVLLVAAALWSLVLCIEDHDPVLYAFAALLSIQPLYVAVRALSIAPHTAITEQTQTRVATTLKELCASAGCPVPRVQWRNGLVAAGVFQRGGSTTLLLSSEFVGSIADDEQRAILAHEISHVLSNDFSALRRLLLFTGTPLFGVLAYVFIFHSRSDTDIPLFWASVVPVIIILQLLVGPFYRHREFSADVNAVIVTGDPGAMVRALDATYAYVHRYRQRVFGSAPWSWLLIPLSLRRTTHPSLEHRIALVTSRGANNAA